MIGECSRADSDLTESGHPLSFLIVSRIFFDQPVPTWSENALEHPPAKWIPVGAKKRMLSVFRRSSAGGEGSA